MPRARAWEAGLDTEVVEKVTSRIAGNLGQGWVAVDLEERGTRLRHSHPLDYPKRYKGKFQCQNASCRRQWSSAMALLVITVQPSGHLFRFSVTALEQSCQKCGRDCYAAVYLDEAMRCAIFLSAAYESGEYPEGMQRGSHMRRPHDKGRCAACKLGLH
eukprot:scaffold7.g3692.t1